MKFLLIFIIIDFTYSADQQDVIKNRIDDDTLQPLKEKIKKLDFRGQTYITKDAEHIQAKKIHDN